MAGDAAEAAGAGGTSTCRSASTPPTLRVVQKSSNLDTILSPGVGTYGPQFNLTDAVASTTPTRPAATSSAARPSASASMRRASSNIFGGLGVVNRGVNPGMPAAPDQVFFDYSADQCKAHLAKSSWDKTKPLRIIFDNSFAGVTSERL
jgi:hypothetical protein